MAGPSARPAADARATIRIDKWLVHARFVKTRALAAELVEKGRVRVNGQRAAKPGHAVGEADVLTLTLGDQVRLIRVLACGQRRGPPAEAQSLYRDLDATPRPLE